MGEVWARPRQPRQDGPGAARRAETAPKAVLADGGPDDEQDDDDDDLRERPGDWEMRWRRVRSVWQRRDEVAQLSSRLGQAARRGTTRAAQQRRSVRWNKVGKDWARVGDVDKQDPAYDEQQKQQPQQQQQEQQQQQQEKQQQPDKRNVWEECARLGQEWTSRRSRRAAPKGSPKGKDGARLLGAPRPRPLILSAPASRSPSPVRLRRASVGGDLSGSPQGIAVVHIARGPAGLTWSPPGFSSTRTSRRASLASSDGDEDNDDDSGGEAPGKVPPSLWGDFRQGMATMLNRLEPAAHEKRPLLGAGGGPPFRSQAVGEGVALQPAGGPAHQEAGAQPLQRGQQPVRQPVAAADLQQGRVRQASSWLRVGVQGHQGEDLHEQGHPRAVRDPQPGGRAADRGWDAGQSHVLPGRVSDVHCDQRQGGGAVAAGEEAGTG